MFSLLERHTIQQLRKLGATQKAIRKATGISERTIYRIQGEPPVTNSDEESFRKSRHVGRPSTAEQHEETVRQWLEEHR